ncbi:MAG: hypothetical protein N2559_14580 [Anaerolineae bacterium]|nr:hypothetical protein [Anaerolineae bacterium]
MNILDENILESQRQLLLRWKISFRQIGYEVGRKGMSDEEIIPLLLALRQPTFFSMDSDFFKRELCHSRYGLVYLDVDDLEAAFFIRRLISHHTFDTYAKRLGRVMRVSAAGIDVWRLHSKQVERLYWTD